MISPAHRIAVVAGAVALLGSAVAPLAAESVSFSFAPPIGSRFSDRELQTTEIRIGNNKEISRIASLTTMRVFKEGRSVYVAYRTEELAGSKDGGAFETPPQVAAFKGQEIVRVLNPDGTLIRIDGYKEFAAKALPLMTGEAKASLQRFIAEGRAVDRDRAAWYELEMLVNQTLELDRDYWYDAAWAEDKGWIAHQTLVRLGPWVQHATGGRLLTVHMAYVPNALAAVPEAVKLVPKVASKLDPLAPGKFAPGERVEGSTTWLVDPATLLTWQVSSHRKVSQPKVVNDALTVTLVTETRVEKTLTPAAVAPR